MSLDVKYQCNAENIGKVGIIQNAETMVSVHFIRGLIAIQLHELSYIAVPVIYNKLLLQTCDNVIVFAGSPRDCTYLTILPRRL